LVCGSAGGAWRASRRVFDVPPRDRLAVIRPI
jgi:hypothetical protein